MSQDMTHPESSCERCEGPNPNWFSPEWRVVRGHGSGILCPSCFAAEAPPGVWMFTRMTPADEDRRAVLAAFLDSVSSLGVDAGRVAGCLLDAGWKPPSQEASDG